MMQVDSTQLAEAAKEAITEQARQLFEDVGQDEEFDLSNGPLGHLKDQVMDESYFSAARWEDFFEEILETAADAQEALQPALAVTGAPHDGAPQPTLDL